MKRLWLLLCIALLAGTVAIAQEKPDNDERQETKTEKAKQAAKKAARATKDEAVKAGRATKHAAVAAKDKMTGERTEERREGAEDRAERREGTVQEERSEGTAQERAEQQERDRSMLPESERGETGREEGLERSVHIVSGPEVATTGRTATIRWTTNKLGANDVWLEGGGIRGHRTRYERGGSRNHAVTFTGLRPNTTYTFLIRTREGEVRKEGTFTTR